MYMSKIQKDVVTQAGLAALQEERPLAEGVINVWLQYCVL